MAALALPRARAASTRPRLAAALLLVLLTTGSAHADEIKAFPAGGDTVSKKDHGSHHILYRGHEGYLERWMLMVHRKDGGWLQAAFILTNMGVGDGHCVVDVQRHAPALGKPGTPHEFSRHAQKFKAGGFKAGTGQLAVAIDRSWIRPTKTGYRAHIYAWGYELELEVRTRTPPWKPGALGGIDFPGGGRYRLHLMPASGTVKGRERRGGGAWSSFEGTSWGDHGATNMMPHKLATRWLRYRGESGGYTVNYQELFTPKNWNSERFGWLLVTRGTKVIASSLSARMTRIKSRKERVAPGHRIPVRYRVEAQTEAGPAVLTVAITGRLHREEVLRPLPRFIRSVIEMFVQPVMFYERARFELTLGKTRVRGKTGVSIYAPLRVK